MDTTLEKVQNESLGLSKQMETVKAANQELIDIKSSVQEKQKEVQASFSEVKSNEKLINSFALKVKDKDNRLIEIENETNTYSATLVKFSSERDKLLSEANSLIDSAKQALEYKTAEGISASFQSHYSDAKKSENYWWLVGAGFSLLLTVGIGAWIVYDDLNSLKIIAGRIALLPFPILSAVFCAKQFERKENIKEDYAYKMVLSKAMVGFSEQIKKHGSDSNEEYLHYMKKVLDEIHLDPLRSRDAKTGPPKNENTNTINVDKIIEILEKLTKNRTL